MYEVFDIGLGSVYQYLNPLKKTDLIRGDIGSNLPFFTNVSLNVSYYFTKKRKNTKN